MLNWAAEPSRGLNVHLVVRHSQVHLLLQFDVVSTAEGPSTDRHAAVVVTFVEVVRGGEGGQRKSRSLLSLGRSRDSSK